MEIGPRCLIAAKPIPVLPEIHARRQSHLPLPRGRRSYGPARQLNVIILLLTAGQERSQPQTSRCLPIWPADDRSATAVIVIRIAPTAGGAAIVAALGWPVVALGCTALIGIEGLTMWAGSSPDRTRRLATLIRATRSQPARSIQLADPDG